MVRDSLVAAAFVPGFVVNRAGAASAAALETAGSTLTATKYQDSGVPRALGSYPNQLPWGTGFLPSATFYPEYLQLAADGTRVVSSTRVPSSTPVPGTTDATFSLDVFAYDLPTDATILVTTAAGQPTVAAGAGQAAFPGGQPPGPTVATLELFDSQNHAVSRDGRTIAVSSSSGNLIAGLVDNNVTFRPYGVVGGPGQTTGPTPMLLSLRVQQQAATDVFAVRPDTRTAFLVNTPNGVANTNHNASFGGMSADGSTFLFGTIANNFYNPDCGNPPYPPFATGPLPANFLLGGFEHLWARQVDRGTTTLVSVGWQNDASGNRPTAVTPVAPGAPDVLPNVSETGRFIMFSTASNNIVPGIANRTFKGSLYVRDMQTGVAALVSTTATGNFPSTGTFLEYALAADDTAGTARFFRGDQSRPVLDFRSRHVRPHRRRVPRHAGHGPGAEAGRKRGLCGRRRHESKGVRVAARANRIAIATGPGSQPAVRVLALRNLAWSVESLQAPPLGATGTKGLFIGRRGRPSPPHVNVATGDEPK